MKYCRPLRLWIAVVTSIACVFGCGDRLIAGGDTSKQLKKLLLNFKIYKLPLLEKASLVRVKDDEGNEFIAFFLKPDSKWNFARVQFGLEDWPAEIFKIEKVEPKRGLVAKTECGWADDLVIAVQCKARGWDELAAALLERYEKRSKEIPFPNKESVEAKLAKTAWHYWEYKLIDPKNDRKRIGDMLNTIHKLTPKVFGPRERYLIRSIELALIPSKAKPGSMESLVDDLIEAQPQWFMGQIMYHDPRYLKLGMRGFAAVPILIKHLDDDRLTKTYKQPFNNFTGFHYRVRHTVSDMLQRLSGEDLDVWLVRGDWVSKKKALEWWDRAKKIGEEKYFVSRVLGTSRETDYPNMLMLDIITKKYPHQLRTLYRKILNERPKMGGAPVGDAVNASSLPRKIKSELFLLGAKHNLHETKYNALSNLRTLDPKQYRKMMIDTLDSLPKSPRKSYWWCAEAQYAGLVAETDDPQVWQALVRYAKRADVGLRLEMLKNVTFADDELKTKQHRLKFLSRFLNDKTVRDVSKNRKMYQTFWAGQEFPVLVVRNYAAMCIAEMLELKS